MAKYSYEEYTHNLDSPNEIVPLLVDLFSPRSIVDVGCGIGTFLAAFQKQNISDVLGIDGTWVDFTLFEKYCSKAFFLEKDLEELIQINRKFDIAICLEVAEHLKPSASDTIVQSLVSLSDVIIFSAAVPNQGGQNHYNEQPLSYWQEKFEKHNFRLYDSIRPLIWNNKNVHYWYKQNMVIFSKNELLFLKPTAPIVNIIHPELLNQKEQKINDIRLGNFNTRFYVKVLGRNVIRKAKKLFGV